MLQGDLRLLCGLQVLLVDTGTTQQHVSVGTQHGGPGYYWLVVACISIVSTNSPCMVITSMCYMVSIVQSCGSYQHNTAPQQQHVSVGVLCTVIAGTWWSCA